MTTPQEWIAAGGDFKELLVSSGVLGSYVNHAGQIVVVVPASGTSSFSAVAAAAMGVSVLVEMRDIELTDISNIERLVGQVDWQPRNDDVFFPTALFDPENGRVEIFSDAPSETYAAIVERYGAKVALVGPIFLTSRIADFDSSLGGHYGGALMAHGAQAWECTSGFAVYDRNGKERMVTAGHCFDLGWTINSPQGDSFGVVKERVASLNPDSALVGGTGIRHDPHVYIGGLNADGRNAYVDVVSASDPTFSDLNLCFSGGTNLESCGLYLLYAYTDPDTNEGDRCLTLGQNGEVYCIELDHLRGPTGRGACGGDSGAPVYRYINNSLLTIQIAGTVTGGSNRVEPQWESTRDNRYGGVACAGDLQTDAYIMRWTRIKSAFGLTLQKV